MKNREIRNSAEKKRVPAWLWKMGGLCFILLSLATVLSVARWLVESSHQTAVALVKHKKTFPKDSIRNGVPPSSAQPESSPSSGIPLAELPLVGIYVGDDQAARDELEKELKGISSLMWDSVSSSEVDGVLNFRAVLAKMGMTVPDTMTEAEAAAEFLRRTERFSALLARWREALGIGPWDRRSVDTNYSDSTRGKIHNLAMYLQRLLGSRAEAHLRSGDTDGAWADWQTMNSSADRMDETQISSMFWLWPEMIQTAHVGIELGTWTDAQLVEISRMMGEKTALASMRQNMELQKLMVTDYLTHFREHQSEIEESFSHSESAMDRMFNRIGISTTTDQQIADNLTVIHFQMDQPLTRFDPDTGIYLGESAGTVGELPRSKPSDLSFDKFYYMYSEMYGDRHDWVTEQVIRSQSAIDQTRIAAALEIQHRDTGEYPATLDAVSGSPLPRDIATGNPYFYQRNEDGGYTLWGTGIDGTSEGGDRKSDVSWTQKPKGSN